MSARANNAAGRDEPLILDPEEEEELARRMDEIPELDRLGLLRPVEELLADVRAEIRRPRTG